MPLQPAGLVVAEVLAGEFDEGGEHRRVDCPDDHDFGFVLIGDAHDKLAHDRHAVLILRHAQEHRGFPVRPPVSLQDGGSQRPRMLPPLSSTNSVSPSIGVASGTGGTAATLAAKRTNASIG